MFEKTKAFYLKNRELIVYYLIGGGTTAIAWGCKYLWNLCFFGGTAYPSVAQNSVLSIIENVAAVAYAYPANRKWVFRSTDPDIPAELAKFTVSRLAAWVVSWALNTLLVNGLGVSIFHSTVLVGIVGANINYVFSKLLVFRKEQFGSKTASYSERSEGSFSAGL